MISRAFSPEAAARLLRSRRARARLVRELLERARRYHFQGYVIDFESLRANAAQRQHQADWRWHPTHRAHWFGFLNQGRLHTVWVEDAWSVAEKLALAWHNQLAGVAGWRLGQEDPRIRVLLRQFQSN